MVCFCKNQVIVYYSQNMRICINMNVINFQVAYSDEFSLCGSIYKSSSCPHASYTTAVTSRDEMVKGKVKESLNRPGVAQRVPEGLGSQIFMTFGT